MRRRPIVTPVVVVLVTAVLAAGCGQTVDTAEVDPDGPRSTTTTAAQQTAAGAPRVAGSSATGPRPTAPSSGTGSGTGTRPVQTATSAQAQAALDLLTRIARDPEGFARANGLTREELARQLGVSPAVLAQLQIDPSSVSAVANLLGRLDRSTLNSLAAGNINPQVVTTVLTLLNSVNPGALQGLGNLDPRVLAVLSSTAQTIDPKILQALGSIVSVADPNGLGQLANDRSSLALLALAFGVALRTDPTQFRQLGALNNLAPGYGFVIDGISSIVQAFDPRTVAFLNEVNRNFSPELIAALAGISNAIAQPQIQAVLTQASKDPQLIANVLGVAALLIPGLAEVIAPDVFRENPNAANAALVALLVTALGRLNGVDLAALGG